MEILGLGGDSWSMQCLMNALREAQQANPDGAYAYASLYFDDLLPRSIQEADIDLAHPSRNRCLKLGLVFNARLARFFGHFEKANYLLIEAIRLSQGSNDFVRLKLALLERGMLEITSSRFALLGRFVRSESAFVTGGNEPNTSESPSIPFFGETNATALAAGTAVVSAGGEQGNTAPDDLELDTNAKYLSQQLVACENYLKALNLEIRCEAPDLVACLLKRCLAFDLGVDRADHSKIIREAARAFSATIEVSRYSTSGSVITEYLHDEYIGELNCLIVPRPKYRSRLVNSEARVILFVNAAYAFALDGKFDKALDIIEEAKKRFVDDENPSAAYHWRVANACIEFDFNLFNGRSVDIDVLSCFSPTEADFRLALLSANRGKYFKALKILENRLNILQGGIDTILIIRCLLVLGTTYCEGGALKSGLKTLQDALQMAKASSLRLFVAAAQRRIAYAHIASGKNLKDARDLLLTCSSELENVFAPRLERGMYNLTQFKLLATDHNDSIKIGIKQAKEALTYLNKARQLFAGHFPHLEKNVYEEGFIFGEKINNEKLFTSCKLKFEEMLHHLSEFLNWFLL